MMKKNYLFVTMLFAVSAVFAQSGFYQPTNSFNSQQHVGIEFMQLVQSFNHQNFLNNERAQFNRLDSLIVSLDTGYGVWLNGMRERYNYNDDGMVTKIISEEWDTLSQSWGSHQTGRYELAYNAQNQLDSIIRFGRDEANTIWRKIEKNTFSFDTNGLLNIYEEAYWDTSEFWGISYWGPSKQLQYFYDANENDTLIIHSHFDENTISWVEVERERRVFDLNNNLIIQHTYETSGSGLDYLDSLHYDANNNLLEAVYYRVNGANVYPSYKLVWTYIANNRFSSFIRSHWVDSVSNWINTRRDLCSYDLNLDADTTIYQSWDNDLNDWQSQGMLCTEHDSNWPNNLLLLPYVPDYYMYYNFQLQYQTSMITEMQLNWFPIGQMHYLQDLEFYYSVVQLLANEIEEIGSLSISPNPANNWINIKLATPEPAIIELIDMNGRMLQTFKLEWQKQLDISSLPAGLFMLRVKNSRSNLGTYRFIKL